MGDLPGLFKVKEGLAYPRQSARIKPNSQGLFVCGFKLPMSDLCARRGAFAAGGAGGALKHTDLTGFIVTYPVLVLARTATTDRRASPKTCQVSIDVRVRFPQIRQGYFVCGFKVPMSDLCARRGARRARGALKHTDLTGFIVTYPVLVLARGSNY